MNKKTIANSFSKASGTYDEQAPVQKWTAQQLCDYVTTLDLNDTPAVLEIGCGTGFLTEMLANKLENAHWTVTDISKDMLATCQERVGDIGTFKVMDGEHPDTDQKFDLIVTSLAIQWFHDLPTGLKALSSLLNEGGHMVFTTLGENTFKEWSEALAHFELETGVHTYPSYDGLSAQKFDACDFGLKRIIHEQFYENGLAFLRALKLIGAHEPSQGYQAISPGKMRQVLRHIDKDTCNMTYDIFLGHIQK